MSTWQARHRRRLATLKARRPGPFDVLDAEQLGRLIEAFGWQQDEYEAHVLARYNRLAATGRRIFHGGL